MEEDTRISPTSHILHTDVLFVYTYYDNLSLYFNMFTYNFNML